MKDTNTRTNRLTVAVLFLVTLIIIGFITISRPDFVYAYSLEESLSQVLSLEDEMDADEAMEIVYDETLGYQFIDIRSPFEYVKGNIEGSKNIPFQNFLKDDQLNFFDEMLEDSITVVIYGWDQTEANGPWMMLIQLGYNNVKVLMGGYGYYSGETFDMYYESEIPQYFVEEPKYNYVGLMESMRGVGIVEKSSNKLEMVIPQRKKKKAVIEGGC